MPNFLPTDLPGVLLIEPDVFGDQRGFFLESYNQRKYDAEGLKERFVQDNHALSSKGVLLGLHAQLKDPQGKLVRVVEGAIFDVAVDIRKGSPAFGRKFCVELSAENFRQLYVPSGFAHGYCVLSERAQVEYKVTTFYDPASEISLLWNDPALGIPWPLEEPVLSKKDAAGKTLAQLSDILPTFE